MLVRHDGPDSVRAALDVPGVTRIGHGVRAVESTEVLAKIVERGITLEVCPTSNICTGVYESLADHPLRQLMDAGARVTLNSDDPHYFATTLAGEYNVAAAHLGFLEAELLTCTRNAIEAGLLSAEEKAALLAKL
ncbi:hypothetical protein L0Z64_19665 (plasmid) [Phaeobacter sp. BS23]